MKTALYRLIPILWLNWGLLLWRLPTQSLWIDEWFTVDIARTPWHEFLTHIIETERRPPLYYALCKVWIMLCGDSEYTMRFYSVAMALLAIAVLSVLGQNVMNRRVGLLAGVLVAASPFVILYGTMIRAYSQTMLLGVLSTWFLLRAVHTPSCVRWGAYGLATLAVIYTDYSGLAVAGGHLLFMLASRRSIHRLREWAITIMATMLSYLPSISIIMQQAARPTRITDLAGGPVGIVLKLAYPFYSWSAGETIFPWHMLAWSAVITSGIALLAGLTYLVRHKLDAFWLIAGLLIVPLLFTATLLTLIALDIPFINAASRTPAAAPFFYLGVATGICTLRRNPTRIAAAGIIMATFIVAAQNLYSSQEYHNPIYAVPIREAVEFVEQQSDPADWYIADGDTLFEYYHGPERTLSTHNMQAVITRLQAEKPPAVWLITFGRDSTIGVTDAEEIRSWLHVHYPHVQLWGYVPQDPRYRVLKERLTGRTAYLYKLTVQRFARE